MADVDLDKYIPLRKCPELLGMPINVCYRTAKRIGIVQTFIGLKFIAKADLEKLRAARLSVGNPRWIASSEEAARASQRGIVQRMKRIRKSGLTEAEKRRNAMLINQKKKKS